VEILKQAQFSPLSVEKQVVIIYCGTQNLMREIPINKVKQFEEEILTRMETSYPNIMEDLKTKLTDEAKETIEKVAAEVVTAIK
jgi:F-type H+-transporting ATPase subunit alpha